MCVCMKIETLMIPDEGRRVMGPGVELPGPRAVSGRRSGERRVRFDCKFEFRTHAGEVLRRRYLLRELAAMGAWMDFKTGGRTQELLKQYHRALRRVLMTQGSQLRLMEGGAL